MDLYTVRNRVMDGTSINDLNLRVVFYARVSTEKEEQLHSLENQVTFFEKYINSNPNWKYIESYIDEGITGTSINKRERFLQMINDAKTHKFDLILTKEISRFSRNTLDSIKYTQELLKNGVAVYFLNDNINTILPDSELRLTIMASIAQDEVRKLSERVRFGMKRSIDNGVVLGSSNIYGYHKENGKLILDNYQAEMIKIIFDRYANTNQGLTSIANELFALGYTTKKGKKLDTTILSHIIENPKYKGFYCGNKSKIVDYRTKEKKRLIKEEWIIYEDNEKVPPIVSEMLWEKANRKLEARKKSFKNKKIDKMIFQNRYTYSGKIYCSKHQETYHRSGSGKRKEKPVWECQKYRKEGLKGCDNGKVIEEELDKLFVKIIVKFYEKNPNIINCIVDEYRNYRIENNSDLEIKKLEEKSNVISKKKDKLLELLMEGYLEKIEYKKQVDSLNKKMISYVEQIKMLRFEKNDLASIEKDINILKQVLKASVQEYECFKEICCALIEKIVVEKQGEKKLTLEIYLKTGELLKATSDTAGQKYHLIESYTTSNSGFCSSEWR